MFGTIGLVLGAPLAAYGLLLSVAPYLILRLILALSRPTPYRVALTKLLGGGALFAAWYAAVTYGIWRLTHADAGTWPAVLVAVSTVPASLFALRYVTDLRLHRLDPNALLRQLWHRRRFARLIARRRRLTRELAELRLDYLRHTEEELALDDSRSEEELALDKLE